MNKFPSQEVEVVAVNGTFDTEAGFKKPLARHFSSKQMQFLELEDEEDGDVETDRVIARKLISDNEYKAWLNEERITKLDESQAVCAHARVLYAKSDYRNELRSGWPSDMDWREHEDVYYVVAPRQTCIATLDNWTNDTLEQTTERFSEFLSSIEPWTIDAQDLLAAAERLVDMSLNTAQDDRLLWRSWLLYGAIKAYSHNPEQVGLDFSRFLSRQFPNWDWLQYQEEISKLLDVLLQRSTPTRQKDQQVRRIDSRLRQIKLTNNVEQQVELAREFADKSLANLDENSVDAKVVVVGDTLPLTHKLLEVISGDAAFFMPNVCDVSKGVYSVDVLEFLLAGSAHSLPMRTIGRMICEATDVNIGHDSVPIVGPTK